MARQQQQVNLKIKGLFVSGNDFSGVPDGALDVADNIVIDYENLAESRRGFTQLTGSFGASDDRANQFVTYQDHIIIHYGDTGLAYYAAAAWHDYSGSYAYPDTSLPARVRFTQAKKNLYFSTSAGVYKLDAYNSTPVVAGVPKGLDLKLALTGSSGFFTANEQVSLVANTTNASPTLTFIDDLTGIEAGQYISGSGITSGTTVSSLSESAVTRITTGDTASPGAVAISAVPTNTTGIAVGSLIKLYDSTGAVLTQPYTRVTVISAGPPYTLTIDQGVLNSVTGGRVEVYSDNTITMSANATATASAVTLSFSDGAQVAYRLLWGYRDANNNVLYGAPSQYTAIQNTTGATTNVQVTSSIPSGITTSHFYQIYRSNQTASIDVVPTDDEQLVYEANPSAGDITAGFVQVTDTTPDSLRGATLYTSTSQEGIQQANEQPPFCKDLCSFRGFNIYANVKSKQRKKFTVLAVGGSSGVALNDTLTIAGTVYTAKSSETIASGEYQLVTSGTPAQNITDTVNSLIRVINRYTSNTRVYAYLLSGPTDLPGQILIEDRAYGGATFTIAASAHGSAFSPSLASAISSEQDVFKNGIMVSKDGEQEAVPTANIFFAGDAAAEILRVIPLREYVVILKQDGIYRLTGTNYSTLNLDPFDLTTNLLAPESAVELSNEVWGFFDQGVCSVSDTGVNIKSLPIENVLRALIGEAIDTVKSVSFGVGYQTDRKYILSLPDADGDAFCNQQYVFNTYTSAWTRWTRDCTAGFINKDEDKLYLGNGTEDTVSHERKSNDYTDYVDESFSVTISSSSSYTVTLASSSGVEEGDVLYQDSTHYALITAISGNDLTVASLVTWSNGAATILTKIDNVIQWKPATAGNPGFNRQVSEGLVFFKQTRFSEASIDCYTDVSQSFAETPLEGFGSTAWGLFGWGEEPWGGLNRPRTLRFLIPQEKQICSQISMRLVISQGYSNWKSEGMSLSFNSISQEVI